MGILRHRSVDALYSRDLRRALQTATVLGNALGLPVQADSALRERCFGVFEGGPQTALRPDMTGIRLGRVENVHVRPQGGESLDDLYVRVGVFVDWLHLHESGHNVVIVTHGGTMRAIRGYCAGRTAEEMIWDHVPNGSVWRIAGIFTSGQQSQGKRRGGGRSFSIH